MVSWLSIFPVAEALFSLGISLVLCKKWWATGDKSTKFWAWAFLFHFMSYFIAGFFVSRLVVLQAVQYFFLQFARQTLESLLFLSVYFGIINLLTTKRSLTFTLPFIFFLLQEGVLLYFDFFARNLRIADQLHIVFFDIPFNILVALLFWKYYSVSKKKYAAYLAAGWFLYAVFVPVYFYTDGNPLLYAISLSHIIVMFIGFVLLYESPTGQAILDITPAVERRLSTAMKYQLASGKTYLVEEEKPEKAYDIFMDAVLHGIRGLVITRAQPERIQQAFNLQVTPVLWLTHVHTALPVVDPGELEQFVFLVDKFASDAKEQALTEGEAPPSQSQPQSPNYMPPVIVPQPSAPSPTTMQKQQEPSASAAPKQEPEWQQKMKEIVTAVKQEGKKPVVLGEEKPLKEVINEAKKKGVPPEVKRGKMIVLDDELKPEEKKNQEEKSEKKEALVLQSLTPQPQAPNPMSSTPESKQQAQLPQSQSTSPTQVPAVSVPRLPQESTELVDKPLKELVAEAQKSGDSVEIKGKPSGGGAVVKKGKMLILGEEKEEQKKEEQKSEQTKAFFILAVGDVSSTGGLNKSIVIIDGLEYLVSNNTFTAVLHMLQTLKDKISLGESMLLIPVNPKCFTEQEINMLRLEFEAHIAEKN